MSCNRIFRRPTLRRLEHVVGKPVMWALTNGSYGHTVNVVTTDGEEFVVTDDRAESTGCIWKPRADGYWYLDSPQVATVSRSGVS
jgi:hypothetical protein